MYDKLDRIRQVVERGYRLSESNGQYLLDKIDELEKEKQSMIATKKVVVNVPPLPESVVIDVLQKQVLSLQVQLATMQQRRITDYTN